jgi:hypothetical protein
MATYGRAHDAVPAANGAGGLDEEEKHDDAAVPGDRRMVKRPKEEQATATEDEEEKHDELVEDWRGRHLGEAVTLTALWSASEEHIAGR